MVLCLVSFVACGGGDVPRPAGGTFFYVTFDERHGLEGGELVRLLDFDIGSIEEVELFGGRVRTKVVLSEEALSNLTEATTFAVDSGDTGLFLETYVLDADASRLAQGDTVAGVDSSLELAARRAAAAASGFLGAGASAEWWEKGAELASEMRKELDAVDWKKEEQSLKEQWARTVETLDKATDEGIEEARASVASLVRALERSGYPDEAKKLQRRFEELRKEDESR